MIDKRKEYVTQCGHDVVIHSTEMGGAFPVHGAYRIDGDWIVRRWSSVGVSEFTTTLNLTEKPQTVSRWVNFHEGFVNGPFFSMDDANAAQNLHRLAVVRIDVTGDKVTATVEGV